MGGLCVIDEGRSESQMKSEVVKGTLELEKKIVIIGAGPAGIHMASKLIKSGYKNIKILEKTGRTCGKSYTIPDDHDEYQSVHELGTCYLHPEYFVIERLLSEYDPNNKAIEVPTRGALGTHLNEKVQHKSEEKSVRFGKWVSNEVERLACPKWLQWVDKTLTGTLTFRKAIKMYNKLHRDLFGKQNNNACYGFPKRPSSKEKLQTINCSFLKWLCINKLHALIPSFVYSQSVQGYGTLDKVPAYYGLFWNTPELLEQLTDIWRQIQKKPNVMVLSKGFQSLWTNMVNKHNMDIVLNCTVIDINRHLSDENNTNKLTSIRYKISDETNEIECDYLFLACGCKKALDGFLNDATDQEKEVFSHLQRHTLCTTLYESDIDEHHDASAVEIWPNVIWRANGELHAHRHSFKTIHGHDKYQELVEKSVIKRDRTVAYQFMNKAPIQEGPAEHKELEEQLKKDLEVWGEKNVKILKQTCWDYFPIWNNECIMKGYPWIVKDEMQGKYGNTYYIGSSVCFESVLSVCEYNNELFDEHFGSLLNSSTMNDKDIHNLDFIENFNCLCV